MDKGQENQKYNKQERSVIDCTYLVDRFSAKTLVTIKIDDLCPFNSRKAKRGTKVTYSYHNAIMVELNLVTEKRP